MGVLSVDHTLTADGETKAWNVPVSEQYMFYAVGDFGGGQLSLEASPNGGVDWFTVDQLSGSGRLIRYLVNGEIVKFCIEGSTSPNVITGLRQ